MCGSRALGHLLGASGACNSLCQILIVVTFNWISMFIHLVICVVAREYWGLNSSLECVILEGPQYLLTDQELIRICHGKELTIPLTSCARLQLHRGVWYMPTYLLPLMHTYFLILEYLGLYLPASGAPLPMWSSLAIIISL